MIAYPDTSFLCAMYRNQVNSIEAARYFSQMPEPLYITSPLLFEFRQSIRWQAFLNTKDSSKGFHKTTAQAVLSKFHANIASGAIVVLPVDWADVASIAEHLSAQYTWTKGYRGFDVIHVATALHLGATEFLSFDEKQKELAESEGLHVPL